MILLVVGGSTWYEMTPPPMLCEATGISPFPVIRFSCLGEVREQTHSLTGSFQMKGHTSRQAKSPIWLKIGYVVLMTHTNKKWKTWFLIFGPQEGFTGLRNCRFYPKMLPIRPTLRALTFLFLKIIEKFQLWVKEGKKCKKKFLVILGWVKFFLSKIKK